MEEGSQLKVMESSQQEAIQEKSKEGSQRVSLTYDQYKRLVRRYEKARLRGFLVWDSANDGTYVKSIHGEL